MSAETKITARHMAWLIVTVRTAVVITTILSIEAGAAQDAWISEIIALPIELGMALVIIALGIRFPGRSIFQYPKDIFGKFIGTLLTFSYLWYFFFISTTLLRELSTFMTTVFLPETPPIPVMALFLAVLTYAVYLGIENIARFTDLFFPLLLLMFLISWVFILPELDFARLMPIYTENGFSTILRGGLVASSGFMFAGAIGVLFPMVNTQNQALKAVSLGLLTATVIISFSTAITIAALGAKQAEMISYKGLTISQLITVAEFAERLDPLALVTWVGATFIKISVFFYCFIAGCRESLQTKRTQVLIVPSAILLVAFSMLVFPDFPRLQDFISRGFVIHNHIFILIIPAFMLLAALVLGKKGDSHAAKAD